jgi:myo-inositol 2-dehydrogenase/D-chiro-inositol 1-dehydrogenase
VTDLDTARAAEAAARVGATVLPTGPSAWDGYAATVITDAAVRSLEAGGQVVTVDMKPRPAFYGGTV